MEMPVQLKTCAGLPAGMPSPYAVIKLPWYLDRCPVWYQKFVSSLEDDKALIAYLQRYDAVLADVKGKIFDVHYAYDLIFHTADGYTEFYLTWM